MKTRTTLLYSTLFLSLGLHLSACSESDDSTSKNGDTSTNTSTNTDTSTNTNTNTSTNTDTSTSTNTNTNTNTDVGTGGTGNVPGTGGTGAVDLSAVFSVSAQLASDVNQQAPGTVGIVEWSVDVAPQTAYIEFGLDTSYGMAAPVDLSEADYRTLLLGMKPNSEYHYRVIAVADGTTYASDDYTISTGPATNLVTLNSFDIVNDSAREPGFIITEYFQSGMGGGGFAGSIAFILDADGDIVWWYQSSLGSLARARMSADGKNMWLASSGLDGAPLERVSMDTLDSQTYNVGASHDITAVEGETMAYLDYSESDCDSIFEITPSGQTTEIFESSDVVSGQCHSNALRYSAAENVYTFSDHRTDIFVIDRSTGNVTWKLTDRVGSNQSWGGSQHGHHLLDNSLLVFANEGGDARAAAVIEYNLQGQELNRFSAGVSTSNLGDVQRLPGGNTLVTYSTSSVAHELDSSGNAVLRINYGSAIGYAMWRSSLYGAPPDLSL